MELTIPEMNKLVRKIISEEGWFTFDTYNNKIKEGRKIKYMGNGWPVPKKMQEKIIAKVVKIVPKNYKVSFEKGQAWGGPYDYLKIIIPDKK